MSQLLVQYQQLWWKEEKRDTHTLAMMAAIISGNGIESPTAVREARRILDLTREDQEIRVREKVEKQMKRERGH